MKIATIVPTDDLYLESRSDYHMCLAHLMCNDTYRKFFEWQAARGAHVIMDNGVVETGEPLPMHKLIDIADESSVTEMTLPDKINDRMITLHMHAHALNMIHTGYAWMNLKVMCIPQGCTKNDWMNSVDDMLVLAKRYPAVRSVGISKFCVGDKMFKSRLEALRSVPRLINSELDIHLLGCPDGPAGIRDIDGAFPGRIRGVDSGLPTFYTMAGKILTMRSARPPDAELDFNHESYPAWRKLLETNVRAWKRLILRGRQ